MNKSKQLTLSEMYNDCSDFFENDKPRFFKLLDDNIDIEAFIPHSFKNHFYANTGRPRKYELSSFIRALLLQKIFSIPSDTLLIVFLKYSKELRDFCGFSKVPDGSKFTRFKQSFVSDLKTMFHRLVDITEPICQSIDENLASMLAFDTSGIEAFVTENNPKYANKIIKQLKTYKKIMKLGDSFDPYKAAYGSMPTHASANENIKQLYINGHFCYVYKFGLITNGLGIVRDISFYNSEFIKAHPELIIEKKSDSPDEDKSLSDSKALFPVMKDFLKAHPSIEPSIFLGDAAFDNILTYSFLLNDCHFKKAFIPLNTRSGAKHNDIELNESGVPLCPKDTSITLKPESTSRLRNGVLRYKFVCPKVKWVGKRRQCYCQNPCTASPCGRMTYVYPERNLRFYPGTIRDSDEWDTTYKIRGVVEKSINHFKDSFCIANRKTQNETTIHADLLLAGITQLITVILADKIHKHQFIRSLKPLIA